MSDKRIFVFGDLHFPFSDWKKINKALSYLKTWHKQQKIDYVIQVGDIYDCYSASRFARTANLISPEQEIQQGYEQANAFWKKVERCAPGVKKVQLRGNHEKRWIIRTLEKAPELETFARAGIEGLFKFDVDVEIQKNERTEYIIDDIVFIHGFYHQQMKHLKYFAPSGYSVVFGHLHKIWTNYLTVRDKTLFEMCVGHFANCETTPMSYTFTRKVSNWTSGFGFINKGIPYVIPV